MKKEKQQKPALAALPVDTRTMPLHDQIATQAHILWEHYGQPEGKDVSIWLEAERQVLGVDGEIQAVPGGAVAAWELSEALTPDPAKTTSTSGPSPTPPR